jgi:SdrD B-like domain
MKSYSILLLWMFILLFAPNSHAQISGKVFRDFNANGTQQISGAFIEPNVQGITVTAYKSDGTSVTTTTTINGTYSFSTAQLPSSTKVRLEFTGLATSDYAGAVGSGSATSVQFVTAGAATTTANFGINYPSDYSQTDPELATPCYVNGRPAGATDDVLVSVPYSAVGTSPTVTHIAVSSEIGAVWGLAYRRTTKDLFAASFLKRHVAMKDNNADGKEDLGAIYVINSAGTPSLWLDVTTLSIDVGMSLLPNIATRALPTDKTQPSYDAAVFDLVGKIGLGDIDISDDETTLYFVNLYNKSLYAIDIATKTIKLGFPVAIPAECNTGSGSVRPFGLKFYKGSIYVGSICDAQTLQQATDLEANIYKLNGAAFANILTFPLNYPKGYASDGTECIPLTGWYPWTNTFPAECATTNATYNPLVYPQPVLTDIEFDVDGSMILGFFDRMGHQAGHYNYGLSGTTLYRTRIGGDILRASISGGVYTLENNASAGGVTTGGANNNQGPGNGEFYFEERIYVSPRDRHQETVMGGLALRAGSGEVQMTAMDPMSGASSGYDSGGLIALSNTTGMKTDSVRLYQTGGSSIGDGTFSKANGLGDLELLADPAPIEIGNRVWTDTDNDGIQDADELGISGITITLCLASAPTTAVATATTDANGNYYFSSAAGTSTASAIYGLNLTFNTNYILKFPTTSGANTISTKPNTGTNDLIDTDADATGKITFTTGTAGQNNHSFDVGYSITSAACAINATITQGACNNNSTNPLTTDDYYTLNVNASATNGSASFEVLLNGNILNTGGTNYGTSLIVGTNKEFKADGTTIYTLTIRDKTTTSCSISKTTTPVASCSNCPTQLCPIVTLQKMP